MEVLVKKIKYIRGIPEEMTGKAMAAGELKTGSIVDLEVFFKNYNTEALIELHLTREGQEALVKEGLLIPVEDRAQKYYLLDNWTLYSKKTTEAEVTASVKNEESRSIYASGS